jgi:SNF2 family DNA or RNA helicase
MYCGVRCARAFRLKSKRRNIATIDDSSDESEEEPAAAKDLTKYIHTVVFLACLLLILTMATIRFDVFLTSYEMLVKATSESKFIRRTRFETMIVDEAHRLKMGKKSNNRQQAAAARQFSNTLMALFCFYY